MFPARTTGGLVSVAHFEPSGEQAGTGSLFPGWNCSGSARSAPSRRFEPGLGADESTALINRKLPSRASAGAVHRRSSPSSMDCLSKGGCDPCPTPWAQSALSPFGASDRPTLLSLACLLLLGGVGSYRETPANEVRQSAHEGSRLCPGAPNGRQLAPPPHPLTSPRDLRQTIQRQPSQPDQAFQLTSRCRDSPLCAGRSQGVEPSCGCRGCCKEGGEAGAEEAGARHGGLKHRARRRENFFETARRLFFSFTARSNRSRLWTTQGRRKRIRHLV